MTDISLYCALMEDVKQRVAIIRNFTRGAASFGRSDFDAEVICLQFRKILESIAFGSLVAHREAYEAAHSDIDSRWRATQILKRIENIHAKFYPEPMNPRRVDEDRVHMDPLTQGYLTRTDFETLYDKCSDALHMWSPFRPGPRELDFGHSLDEWCNKVQNLLCFHVIWMIGTEGGWLVTMEHPDGGKVHTSCFEPIDRPSLTASQASARTL